MSFEEMIPDLFEVVPRSGARPDVPREAEEFFTQLVARFTDREACRRYIEEHLLEWFRCLRDQPAWIQEPDWPWEGGKPMVFVGSLDPPAGTFHDDARFFVFWSPEIGTTRCVIQVA
jgi:hypothetical protein